MNNRTPYYDKLKDNFTFLHRWERKAKAIILPGTEGIPIWNIMAFFIREIQQENINIRAGFIAYNFVMALFPFVIFLFTLVPYIPLENFTSTLFTNLREVLPTATYKVVRKTIIDLVQTQRKGLLSLGFLLTIYFASNGMNAIILAFNKKYKTTFRRRNFFQNRWVSIKLVFVLTFLVIFSIITIIFGNLIINNILTLLEIKNSLTYFIIHSVKWLFIVFFYLISISSIYYYGPAYRKRASFFTAGSTIASVLSILSSVGFSYYVNNFGQYNKLYGSLGTIIVCMIWVYINSLILLIGFELNASIAVQRDLKKLAEEENSYSGDED